MPRRPRLTPVPARAEKGGNDDDREEPVATIRLGACRVPLAVEHAGCNGPQEVEIFSAGDRSTRPGEQVLATCRGRFEAACRA